MIEYEKTNLSIQIYKLPQSSLAELARNSVIQSGFEMEVKRHWLGQTWYLPGAAGNNIHKVRYRRAVCALLMCNLCQCCPLVDECAGY